LTIRAVKATVERPDYAASRSGRVYLCANVERFRLGIVEGNLKYIDDYA
jgi:hypothetical protein